MKAEASHFETRSKDTLVEGKSIPLSSIIVDGKEKQIIITGKLMHTARIAEEWHEDVEAPEAIIEGIRKSGSKVVVISSGSPLRWELSSKPLISMTTVSSAG